jgi:transposase
LRLAIIANSRDAQIWLVHILSPEAKSSAPEKTDQMISVFGIRESWGAVMIDLLECLPLETFVQLKPKALRRSSIYYTIAYQNYKSLVFHNHESTGCRSVDEDPQQVYRIDEESPFWRYANTRILGYRGISRGKFPHYLKELEFRYNNRQNPIFYPLCRYLVSFIPAI